MIRGRQRPRTWPAALAIGLLVVGTGWREWWTGRPLACRCGRVRLWAGQVHGPENSQQLADWYSLGHVVHGLLLYAALRVLLPRLALRWRLVPAVASEAGWELLENSPAVIARYRAATVAWGYQGDSVLNSLADIGCMVLGFLVARTVPVQAAIAAGVAAELLALAAIRDDLTLNVLMLVHPLPAVLAWQGAAS